MSLTIQDIEKLLDRKLKGFARKKDITALENQMATKDDLLNFATKDDLKALSRDMHNEMNELYAFVNERHEALILLIGNYWEKCPTKGEHQHLVRRVEKLEAVAA